MAGIWDIVLPNLGSIATLITLLTLFYKIGRWMQRVEDRLENLEKNPIIVAGSKLSAKVLSDILYEIFEKKLKANPLTADEINLRRQLTEKLDAGTITPDEAKILYDILSKELAEAQAAGNILAVLVIILLIGLVAASLPD
ncbi:MAG: hypothetical protein LM590_00075 [Thermofilum sp.]|jgi:hypothetical protein|nr:hypothetical protein [Thermofilum sp.]